jgi:hypothetical protein
MIERGPILAVHGVVRWQLIFGRVDAPDREAAEAIAETEFDLTDEQRNKLVRKKV